MGNCFSGLKKKKNKVCPSAEVEDKRCPSAEVEDKRCPSAEVEDKRNIYEVLSEATDFKKPSAHEQADMAKDLEEMGIEPTVGGQGVAFVVSMVDDKSDDIAHTETAGKSDEKRVPYKEIMYTDEEELLMEEILRDALAKERMEKAMKMEIKMLEAEIVREANMKERQEKARQVDIKISNAAQRRQNVEIVKVLELTEKERATPNISERRKKVKEMADETRRKAAEARTAMEE